VAADSFLVPGNATEELVQELSTGKSGFSRRSRAAYSVTTEHSWLLIPEELYWKIHPYSMVQVERSSVTGAQKKLIVYEGNQLLPWDLITSKMDLVSICFLLSWLLVQFWPSFLNESVINTAAPP
jgi:hypothetical protein